MLVINFGLHICRYPNEFILGGAATLFKSQSDRSFETDANRCEHRRQRTQY